MYKIKRFSRGTIGRMATELAKSARGSSGISISTVDTKKFKKVANPILSRYGKRFDKSRYIGTTSEGNLLSMRTGHKVVSKPIIPVPPKPVQGKFDFMGEVETVSKPGRDNWNTTIGMNNESSSKLKINRSGSINKIMRDQRFNINKATNKQYKIPFN